MKEEAKADAELSAAFGHATAEEIIARCARGERGRRFIAERIEPYQKEFGWHAVWSHEFIFPTVYEKMEPVIELVRGYMRDRLRLPRDDGRAARRHRRRVTGDPRRA